MIRRWPTSFAMTVLIVTTVLISSIMNSMGVLAQSHAQSAQYPFDFMAYGMFSRMITQRNYLPVVALKDAVDGGATDAVGAVSGLPGEISVVERRLIVSYGADCAATCPSVAEETATLLTTAAVRDWRPIPIDKDLPAHVRSINCLRCTPRQIEGGQPTISA